MNELFKSILDWIYSWAGNYGWATIIFTILVRMILFPFDYKSRVSMRKTSKLQPKMAALQKKYANDREKLGQKQAELYKKEGVNPMSSCLPMLLMYPLLIWMFTAMRMVSYEHITEQVLFVFANPESLPKFDGWLWVKNLWMPDSPFSSSLPDLNNLRQVTSEMWLSALNANDGAGLALLQSFSLDGGATMPLANLTLENFSTDLMGTVSSVYNVLLQTPVYLQNVGNVDGWTINLLITTVSLQKLMNGLFLLPLIAGGSQFAMTKIMQPSTPQDPQAQQTQNSMKMMNYFFPLFTLWLCSSYNGMFALYWVTGNAIAMVQTFAINKYLDAKDAKAAQASLEGAKK